MKGLNVKKMAALVAGAAILGASLAVADLTYGSTQIVNQNGQPVAKVVVGASAKASDGVVAANIAAKIGNSAYKSETLTATLQGKATCTVTGGAGSGACPISNEKVYLDVTLPGVVSGSAQFKTYVNDYVDKYLEDRATITGANTHSTLTEVKPIFAGGSYSTTGAVTTTSAEVADGTNQHGRKISGSDFPALATTTLRDPSATGQYTEEQSVWVYAGTVYDATVKDVVANAPEVVYKIDFTHDIYGIPVSTCSSYNSSACLAADATSTELTARHRVPVRFLGEDWIISALTPPATTAFYNYVPSGTNVAEADSSSISLAKESAYGVIHVGENMTAGAYTVKLADIGLAETTGNIHPAAVEIYDSTGALLTETKINPDATLSWKAPDGTTVKIKVYQTQPGYTLQSKWAEMAIYSNELTLTHNANVDNTDNKYWRTYLYWSKNPNNNNVPTLKTILVVKDYDAALQLTKGQNLGLIANPTKFQLSFGGLNLESADYDTLTMSIVTTAISYSPTGNPACTDKVLVAAPVSLLYVRSQLTSPFTMEVASVATNQFYVDLNNIATGFTAGLNVTNVYYQQSNIACYYNLTRGSGDKIASYAVGDGASQSLTFGRVRTNSTTAGQITLNMSEYASSTNASAIDELSFDLSNNTGGVWQFNGSANSNRAKYLAASLGTGYVVGPSQYSASAFYVDPAFITERGSVFRSMTTTTASVNVAKKIGEVTYYLNTVGTSPNEPTHITLAEGEQQTLAGGVIIKATKIEETVGACTSAGGACAVDMTPVNAVLSTGEDSAAVITPYSLMSDLVVLDSSAPAGLVVSVGGPVVNTVTQEALSQDSTVKLEKSGDVVVKQIGNTIVVAGYTAEDTATAGKQFVAGLQ
ncbi:MAG: S-layer protein [Candidatus Micrarchaeota archaeon]|nr:S-layer protein [Candidatus Micrarchaeota archaeon]